MSITDPLVLASDLLLVPVAELPESMRERLAGGPAGDGGRGSDGGDVAGDSREWALTRRRGRTPSRLVDRSSAELLAEFRTPSTVAEAVLRFSRARAADPEATLEAAYPLLQRLLAAGFLVEESRAAGGPAPWEPGEEIAGFEVAELIQGYDDVEVYLARGRDGWAVLKVARPDAAGGPAPANPHLVREAAALARLASARGGLAPQLLAAGEVDGRRWLALEWIPGTDAATAAAELRRAGDRAGLLGLARRIAAAYAALHARGFLHGDVHPRNVRVGPAGEVRLLDFGLARWGETPAGDEPARGGVGFFFEPEYALAARAGRRPPPATAAGEQHAVAALCYLLLAGAHAVDFSPEKRELLRQIAEEPPLPFAARGIEPWPQAEAALARALAKAPEERFPSMAAFAAALEAVEPPAPREADSSSGPGPAARALLARTLADLHPDGPLFAGGLPAPRASVRAGAAGVGLALYRIALVREDPELLAQADLWASRAEADGGEGAFDGPGLPPERVGRISPYHAATGPACVAALIAHARGDEPGKRAAIERFLARAGSAGEERSLSSRTAQIPRFARDDNGGSRGLQKGAAEVTPPFDLALGRAGLLAAGALLLDLLTGPASESPGHASLPPGGAAVGEGGRPGGGRVRATLLALGHGVLSDLWERLAALPPIDRSPQRLSTLDPTHDLNLGIAHGWAGLLWATLRWCHASKAPLPTSTLQRLDELADLARPSGRGLRWAWLAAASHDASRRTTPATMPGWCNGSAGFVHLWCMARYPSLAESAAWDAWESPDRDPTLCCGLAGRAYALLRLWREGAGAPWLARARDLAERAAEEAAARKLPPHALYQGAAGIAVLAADLERPEDAAMPLFEEEGWTI